MNIGDIDLNSIKFNNNYYNEMGINASVTEAVTNENGETEYIPRPELPKPYGYIINDDDKIIQSITPLSLYCSENNDKKKGVGSKIILIFLAQAKTGKLFTLNTVYQVETEEEYKFAKMNIPFFNDRNNYSDEYSRQNIDAMLKNTLPAFVSSLDVTTDDILNNNIESLNLTVAYKNEMEINTMTFTISPAIFCCIKFTEAYIRECILNNHDIIMSSAHGFINTPISLFTVDTVDNIISMAKVDKKSKDITVLVRVMYYVEKGVKEALSLLFTTNPGVKFEKGKFNTTIAKINESYMEDSDQYLTELMFDTRINDKAYTCYLAQNKNKYYKLFLLDTKAQTDLTTLVKEFKGVMK
jgi:hypothetical protein